MKNKLTDAQKEMIKTLRKYPHSLIVRLHDKCFLTGGHGVHLDRRILNSLESKKIVEYSGLTELGKIIDLQ